MPDTPNVYAELLAELPEEDAHAHIRLAAEDRVRKWCRANRYLMMVTDSPRGIAIHRVWFADGEYGGMSPLGTGPTIEAALLAAVRYCKEHG